MIVLKMILLINVSKYVNLKTFFTYSLLGIKSYIVNGIISEPFKLECCKYVADTYFDRVYS